MMQATDPTAALTVDFPAYIAQRERAHAAHLVDGMPDYGFSLDLKLRRRMATIPPLRWAVRAASNSVEPIYQNYLSMEAIAVGPRQYPKLHAMAEACARTLGIGLPALFVVHDVNPNAWTLARDDVRPSVVLTARLLEIMAPDELHAVIGHECGHIHNLHGAWQSLAVMLANPLVAGLSAAAGPAGRVVGSLASTAAQLFVARWSRCAEITCDRAGAICCGDPGAMARALVRIQSGLDAETGQIDVDAYVRQIDAVKSTPVRLLELGRSHPLTHKRIEALRLFASSDVLRAWCPRLLGGAPTRPIADVDLECERLVRVWDDSYRTGTEGDGHAG